MDGDDKMRIVRKSIRGFYGMNHYAGKVLKVKAIPAKNTLYIRRGLKGRMLKRTIAHEKIEAYLMSKKGMSYRKADKIAQAFEMNIR